MNKKELAAQIWAGANALRGQVAPSDYKDYMLGFIFYKYISENECKKLKEKLYFTDEDFKSLDENDYKTIRWCKDNVGYFIPYKHLFSTWINMMRTSDNDRNVSKEEIEDFSVANVTKALTYFDTAIGDKYHKVYDGIFESLAIGINSFGNTDSEKTKKISQLLKLIDKIPTTGKEQYDVLGFVYEFLLKNFAVKANKAGEFYTPYEASKVMSEIIINHLKGRDEISIYDPTSGSGSLLINIGKLISKNMISKDRVFYYAQEVVKNTYNLTRMNLIMHDVDPSNIYVRKGDTLAEDWPFFENNDIQKYEYRAVDACCSNPPYSQPWINSDASSDPRFKDYGVAPRGKADYAFLLHNLYHLKHDGIMTIVLPHGVLFRSGDEEEIRTNLIKNNNIETVIGLPPNIFFGTGIPTIIIVIKKFRESSDVLFIDASKGFEKDESKNRLRSRDIKKIVDTAINRKNIEGYSRLVTKEEIIKNNYNLNIPRYISNDKEDNLYDIYSLMYGGIPISEINNYIEYWKTFPSLYSELFETVDCHTLKIKTDNIKKTILSNKEVIMFINDYQNKVTELSSYLKQSLIRNYKYVDIISEENIISEKLRNCVLGFPLVDFYKVYQNYRDIYDYITFDLESLQTQGLDSFRTIEQIKKLKKNSKGELEYEDDKREGKIFSFKFIQNVYFKKETALIQQKESEIAIIKQQIDEYIYSFDESDKTDLLNDENEIDNKKMKEEIAKIRTKIKQGYEVAENSFEDSLIKIGNLFDELAKIKSNLNKIKKDVLVKTEKKITTLTDDEGFKLLEDKWVNSMLRVIKNAAESLIYDFVLIIENLSKKYDKTLNAIETEILDTEKLVVSSIKELEADEYDKKGLEELIKILENKNE